MWVKVDDGFLGHDKTIDAGARLDAAQPTTTGAKGLGRVAAVWLSMATHSNRYLTDGFVTDNVAAGFLCDHDPIAVLQSMQRGGRGLVRKVANGWQLLNYLEYQPSKKNTEKQREKAAIRMRRLRRERARAVRANKKARPKNTRERSQSPTRPDPTRPIYRDQDQDPRLAPRSLALVPVENSDATHDGANNDGPKSPDRACGKPVQNSNTRTLAALARAVLQEDPARYLVELGEFANVVKDGAARAGLGYNSDRVGKACRAAEAWLRRVARGKAS